MIQSVCSLITHGGHRNVDETFGCDQDGGRTHTRVLRKFLCCFMVSDLLLTINHLQVDGEGYRKCEEAGGGIWVRGMEIF